MFLHAFTEEVRLAADVEADVIARCLDPLDLFGAQEQDFAARLDDDAFVSAAL